MHERIVEKNRTGFIQGEKPVKKEKQARKRGRTPAPAFAVGNGNGNGNGKKAKANVQPQLKRKTAGGGLRGWSFYGAVKRLRYCYGVGAGLTPPNVHTLKY